MDRAGRRSSGEKARRPTDPRETGTPGYPRYIYGEEGQRRKKREGGRDSGPGSPERILPRTAPNHEMVPQSRRAPAGNRARRQGGAEG